MNVPPAFQFYAADWLADAKVQAMSIEAEGCYIRLLCYCWREGSIPADRSAIAKLCKGYDGPAIDEVLPCFIPMKKNMDRLINKRLIEERKKQSNYHKSMQMAGLAGARKRWGSHGKAISQAKERPMAKNSSSSSSSSSLKEDSRESSIMAEKPGPLFENLWSQWPNTGRFKKKICLAKFEALYRRGEFEEFRITTIGYSNYLLHKKENEGFEQQPMHLATWLNNWKEEKERYVSEDGKPFQYKHRL